MKENEAKNKPRPSRLRGRGVEMPKAFFYSCKITFSFLLVFRERGGALAMKI